MQAPRIIIFLIMFLLQMEYNWAQQDLILTTSYFNKDNDIDKQNETFKYLHYYPNQESNIVTVKTVPRRRLFRNPCLLLTRQNGKSDSNVYASDIQARFLWSTNVYNIYPYFVPIGCYGGLPFPSRPINRFGSILRLFAPGILQNSLAATTRPQIYGDIGLPNGQNIFQNDELLQNNEHLQRPVPYPMQSLQPIAINPFGVPPQAPAQLISSISTTINSIIQQLTGSAQPAYASVG